MQPTETGKIIVIISKKKVYKFSFIEFQLFPINFVQFLNTTNFSLYKFSFFLNLGDFKLRHHGFTASGDEFAEKFEEMRGDFGNRRSGLN